MKKNIFQCKTRERRKNQLSAYKKVGGYSLPQIYLLKFVSHLLVSIVWLEEKTFAQALKFCCGIFRFHFYKSIYQYYMNTFLIAVILKVLQVTSVCFAVLDIFFVFILQSNVKLKVICIFRDCFFIKSKYRLPSCKPQRYIINRVSLP